MLGKSPRSYSFQQIISHELNEAQLNGTVLWCRHLVMYGECNLNDIKAIQVKFLEISGKNYFINMTVL